MLKINNNKFHALLNKHWQCILIILKVLDKKMQKNKIKKNHLQVSQKLN